MTGSGGLRFAPTPGYSRATLQVANADDESSTSLPFQGWDQIELSYFIPSLRDETLIAKCQPRP